MTDNLPAIIIGTLVLSGGSIVAIVLFWMRLGARLERVESALSASTSALAKAELALLQHADFKAEVAKEYAPLRMLHDVESRLMSAMGGVTERLDKIFMALMDRDDK